MAVALSEVLGGLPLAHEQAAAYCERLDISFADYAKRFEAAPGKFLDDERHAPAEYHDGLTVAKTFALAIDEAARLHPGAEPLIVHAALLAHEPIPLFLFSEGRDKFGEPLSSALKDDGLDEAVASLLGFALIDRETIADERDPAIATDCIRLHRLVRQVAAARYGGERQEQARHALLEALTAVYPDPESIWQDPKAWPRARRLDAPALALVGGANETDLETEKTTAILLLGLACYRHRALAAFQAAQPLYERALAILDKVLGSEHPATAMSLDHLAGLLQDQGNLPAARQLYERALAIKEKMLGPEHRNTATGFNNLALVLRDQGDFAGARPLLERALAIYEKVLGPEHPDTTMSLNNLADLLRDQGNLAGAWRLSERALAIREKELGPEPPHGGKPQHPGPLAAGSGGPRCGTAAVGARAGDPRESARPRAPPHGGKPQHPGPLAAGTGRPRWGAAAVGAGAGDL